MASIVTELKSEHATMLKACEGIAAKTLTSAEIATFVGTLKTLLLGHLQKEDSQFYPKIKKMAETNASLKSKLALFADEMNPIAKAALAFIEKYSKGGDPAQFSIDFKALLYTLKTRIRREEDLLYPEFKE